MYTSFYNLLEKPFELGTDLRYLYLSAHHREALAHLTYGVEERKSFVQLTGEVGTGKTTLLDALVDGLDVTTKVARLSYTTIGEEDLLRELARELGVEPLTGPKIELRRRIADFLDERTREGRNAVFVVDEAQNLSLTVLEEVRLLSNLRSMGINSIQIVLAGQPELREKLELKELRQLRQRIGIRYHLVPLSRAETGEYVAHRLAVAGADETGIFDSGALDMVYEYSKGVPRVINIACDRALLAGYAENKSRIGRKLMGETIDAMEGLVPTEEEESVVMAAAAAAPVAEASGSVGAVSEPVVPAGADRIPRALPETPPVASVREPASSGGGEAEGPAFAADEATPSGVGPAEPAVDFVDGDRSSDSDVVGWSTNAPRRRGRTAFVAVTVVIVAAGVFTLRILKPSLFGWPEPSRSESNSSFTESEMNAASGESSLLDVMVEPGLSASETDPDAGPVPLTHVTPATAAAAEVEDEGAATVEVGADETDADETGADQTDIGESEGTDAGTAVAALPADEPNGNGTRLGAGGGTIVGPGGPYEVVVRSVTTEDGGWVEAAELLEAGFAVDVIRVDLGDKGVWYRVTLDGGFPSLDDARVMTVVLEDAGFGGSWVTKN